MLTVSDFGSAIKDSVLVRPSLYHNTDVLGKERTAADADLWLTWNTIGPPTDRSRDQARRPGNNPGPALPIRYWHVDGFVSEDQTTTAIDFCLGTTT
jgi:hypothetical protein